MKSVLFVLPFDEAMGDFKAMKQKCGGTQEEVESGLISYQVMDIKQPNIYSSMRQFYTMWGFEISDESEHQGVHQHTLEIIYDEVSGSTDSQWERKCCKIYCSLRYLSGMTSI